MSTVPYGPGAALIVVDVQNDFADPKGSLYVAGAETLIDGINAEIERAGTAGATVVYTQDWHPPTTPHFAKDGGIWPEHCVQDSWGAQLHPRLIVAGDIVRKGTGGEDGYSGFSVRDPVSGESKPTELAGLLAARGVGRVYVVGLATDYCVKETAIDAVREGFETTVLTDLVRPVNLQPADGSQALAEMSAAGASLEPLPA